MQTMKIVSQRQYRWFQDLLDWLEKTGQETNGEYSQSDIRALLATADYDALRPIPMRQCACGKCGSQFEAKSGRKYHPECPNRTSKPRAKPKSERSGQRGCRRVWIPGLAMMILVDEAMDRYETRELAETPGLPERAPKRTKANERR